MKNNLTIPKGWRGASLGSIAELYQPETISKNQMLPDGRYLVFGANGIIGKYDRFNHEDSEVIVTCRGASCGSISMTPKQAWITGNAMVIKVDESKVIKPYIYYFLKNSNLNAVISGGAQPQITRQPISAYKILFPELKKEQQEIAGVLGAVDEDIAKTQEVIDTTEKLKRGLMQQLFTRGIGHTKFKETKIGQVPDDWDVVAIKDASIKLIDGDRGVNYPGLSDFTSGGYCLFLNNKNIKNDQFVFSDIQFISREKDEALRKGKLQRLDVVLTTRGTVGNVAFYDKSVTFENIRINSGMILLRAFDGIEPIYLYHLMKSFLMKRKYKEIVSGSAQPQLPIKILDKTFIPIPPEDEQQEISEILSAVDKKISVNKKLKAKLIQLKKGLMQDLLSGKVRVK